MVDMQKPRYRAATLKMLEAVRLVLVRSHSLGKALTDLGCAPDKLRIQRTGIPLNELKWHSRAWPKDGSWHLLQAGRLIEKKGVATSLRAFARFSQTYPNATLTIAGEGPEKEKLEQMARDLGIAGRVKFTGFVSQNELRDFLAASHLFLHPSQVGDDGNQEGVPNSMLEAMASGLPVFATRHGGIPEAVTDGASGFLVAERDDEALSASLLQAARTPELLSLVSQRARKVVEQEFNQERQNEKLEQLFLELITNS
jgi:glycosyltransferase involved in cell wall biosynthesis